MNIYHASKLKAFLEELGIDARKGLSQNFLIDGNILRKIVAAAGVSTGDHILEIGPGPGALTEQLLNRDAHVTAVEIDPILSQALCRFQNPNLTVISQDFLEFPLASFLGDSKVPWKVVANTPYHITTPILTRLLPLYPHITSVTLMVQKEFAKRLVALPKTPDYSHLTLFTRFYSSPKYCFTIEPTCFYPRPKVQSALVHLTLQPPPSVRSVEDFFTFTRKTFQHKRKMLRSSLKELYGSTQVTEALAKMELLPTARPEELALEQFLSLFQLLSSQGS